MFPPILPIINGTLGNDTLIGTFGDDIINGLAGDDVIDGSFGFDQMDGGAGIDTLDVTFWNGAYHLDMNTGLTNFVGETAINFENVYTGAGDDVITGNNANNVISTGAGNDWVDGGLGLDQMDGGAGIDTLDVTFWNGAYHLDMNTGLTNFVGETAINFENVNTGAGNDMITGTNGVNIINTGQGNDVIMAQAGNDIINGYGEMANGSIQMDRLSGGSGDDIFVLGTATGGVFYDEVGDGYAIIEDWNTHSGMIFEQDKIQLKGHAGQYQLEVKSVAGIGSMAQDTEIYYIGGMIRERIGIIQDSTAFTLSASDVNWV